MSLNRIILLLLLAWNAPAFAAATGVGALSGFAVTEIAPGNFVHHGTLEYERSPENMGDQANIGFIVGDACVAVVDPGGSLAVGQALRAAIRRATDKPICYVIITHVHPDHFFGAAAFREDKAVVVGHENLPRGLAMRARPYLNSLKRDLGDLAAGSEVIPPTLLVKDETVLDLGGRAIRVKAWPAGHTDNDLTVFDERTGTLWVADLLFIGHTPVVDGSITGFIEVLDRLKAMDARQYVAGHGKSDLPWPAVLEPEQAYLSLVVRETRAAIRRRKTIQEATDEVGLSERAKWVNFDDYHRRNVTTAYAELEWE
jgi:quinoprotein relay system zinc metallohydrolase 2